MINPPPGGLPPWLQLLPPNLTIPFNAIQQAIDDFVRGLQPATVLPRDDDGVLRDPVLPREDPIIRDPMPDPQPTIIRDPILPQEDPILRDPILPGEDPIIRDIFPPMEGGGIHAATDDDDDSPLRELEGEWRDPRSLPYPPGFSAEREGGSYDPRWDAESLAAGTRPYDKYQDRVSRIVDSEYRYHTGFNPYFDTEGEPWTEWAPGDPTQVLTPGTAQWKEKQAFDRRDALINRAYELHKKWGLDLRDALISIEEEEFVKAQQAVDTAPPSEQSFEQSFADQFAQVPTTERQQSINDLWEVEIQQAEIEARNDADAETRGVESRPRYKIDKQWHWLKDTDFNGRFYDGGYEKSIEYLEDRFPGIDFDDLRVEDPDRPLYNLVKADKLRTLARYVDEYYKNEGNFREDLRTVLKKRADIDWSDDDETPWADKTRDWLEEGLDELKDSGASDFQVMVIRDYLRGLKSIMLLPEDASIGEFGQIIPGETPIDQIVLDFHDEIMNEYNEFSDM